MIASASMLGDPVYTGVVDSVTSSNVNFASGVDENNATIYPFAGSNVFNKDVQLPILTANAAGSSVTISYPGGFDSTGTGFAANNPPAIIIDAPSSGGVASEANATINSDGEVTAVTVSAGSGYTDAPVVTLIGGPHFLRNTTVGSANYGRYFLISTNTQTSLTLDYSRLANGESSTASAYFAVGDTVEVIPATTLGSLFGTDMTQLPSGWSYGTPHDVDWVYLWDTDYSTYYPYGFAGSNYEPAWKRGWYNVRNYDLGVQSNQVIYPDEAFLIAKKTANNVTFTFEGTVQTNDQKLFLPAGDKQILTNNPYGTDLMICELIPSTSIGSGTTKFNPGSSATDNNMDTITLLQSGTWTTYYYDSGTNPSVSATHEVASRKLSTGTMSATDFYIGHGDITGIVSCSVTGDTAGINGNDSNYSKLTISASGSTANALPTTDNGLNGFKITLSSIQGYKLNDDGDSEVDENGTNVANGSGVIIYSNLNGTHEIIDSANGYIVIEKIRDMNLKSNEQDVLASNATTNWAIGTKGSGYSANAKFFCIGGGGPAANHATACIGVISSTGAISSVSGSGSYSSAPQAIVSGGGWRTSSSGTSARGNEVVGATDGVFIDRGYSSGVKTFLASSNPNN